MALATGAMTAWASPWPQADGAGLRTDGTAGNAPVVRQALDEFEALRTRPASFGARRPVASSAAVGDTAKAKEYGNRALKLLMIHDDATRGYLCRPDSSRSARNVA
jgi:hypothetical protein